MTILNAKKHSPTLNIINIFLGILIVVLGVTAMHYYNDSINLRHSISQTQKYLKTEKNLNLDLSSRVDEFRNANSGSKEAVLLGLVLDKFPSYVEVDSLKLAVSN